jgi:hypothetical protein
MSTESKQRGLQFDLAVSFLMLFNKTSARLIYGDSVKEV